MRSASGVRCAEARSAISPAHSIAHTARRAGSAQRSSSPSPGGRKPPEAGQQLTHRPCDLRKARTSGCCVAGFRNRNTGQLVKIAHGGSASRSQSRTCGIAMPAAAAGLKSVRITRSRRSVSLTATVALKHHPIAIRERDDVGAVRKPPRGLRRGDHGPAPEATHGDLPLATILATRWRCMLDRARAARNRGVRRAPTTGPLDRSQPPNVHVKAHAARRRRAPAVPGTRSPGSWRPLLRRRSDSVDR